LVTDGRFFGQTNESVRSGLAIANPNAENAVVSFTFTDETGRDVSSSSWTIPANEQISRFLDEQPFNGPGTFSGSFTFHSSIPVAVIALRGVLNERSEALFTTLPVADIGPASSSGAATVFPYFVDGSGWTTTMMLVNPTDSTLAGVLQFA